jgi:peptide/nickel transport system ATP-binding protein
VLVGGDLPRRGDLRHRAGRQPDRRRLNDAFNPSCTCDEHRLAPLLSVQDLSVEFRTRRGTARVLDGVSFELRRGETLGVVGESGCGKSVTALAILRLIAQPPGRITGGRVIFDGRDLLQPVRARDARGAGQPHLDDLPGADDQPEPGLHRRRPDRRGGAPARRPVAPRRAAARAGAMLDAVGIPDPQRRVHEYPHQFSGGMRQRVMIAMALACKPDVLIADEPTTALDVTVQAQIFDLIADLRERTGTAVMLITHDMGAVAEMTDRVAVMYAGHIVESGAVAEVLREPLHPYTRGLIACAPGARTALPGEFLEEIPGTVPSLIERGAGCLFADRCKHVMPSAAASCRRTRCLLPAAA